MHFALAIDILASEDRKKIIAEHIWNKILEKYKRAKRLGNFYIIKIDSQDDWKLILDSLTTYVNALEEKVHFIMTPIMTGGRYNGILKKDSWDFINEITDNK